MERIAESVINAFNVQFINASDKDYFKSKLGIDGAGKIHLASINETDLLSLVAIPEIPVGSVSRVGLPAIAKKNIAAFYGLWKAYNEAPDVPMGVADDAWLNDFIASANIDYIKGMFAIKYIESSKEGANFKYYKVNSSWGIGTYGWKHTPLNFTPLQTLIVEIDNQMNAFVQAKNYAWRNDLITNCDKSSFPLNNYKTKVTIRKPAFEASSTNLSVWAVKKKDSLPLSLTP